MKGWLKPSDILLSALIVAITGVIMLGLLAIIGEVFE